MSALDFLPVARLAREVFYVHDRGCPPPDIVVAQCAELELAELGSGSTDPLFMELVSQANLIKAHWPTRSPQLFFLGLADRLNYGFPARQDSWPILRSIDTNRKLLNASLQNTQVSGWVLINPVGVDGRRYPQTFHCKTGSSMYTEEQLAARTWIRLVVRSLGQRNRWFHTDPPPEIFLDQLLQYREFKLATRVYNQHAKARAADRSSSMSPPASFPRQPRSHRSSAPPLLLGCLPWTGWVPLGTPVDLMPRSIRGLVPLPGSLL